MSAVTPRHCVVDVRGTPEKYQFIPEGAPIVSRESIMKLARIIHDGSSRNLVEARRGASGTRREERHPFWLPLASGPEPLAQTLAIAAETFMNIAG